MSPAQPRPARSTSAWHSPCIALFIVALLSAGTAAHAQTHEWPGFRGRTGAGYVAEALDAEGLSPSVVWRARVGIGYSGVTVADGRAITLFEDGQQVMVAFDVETGAELWRRRVGEVYPGRDGSWNGPIATPVVMGSTVVTLEPWGRLFALDTTDGEPVWSVHLTEDLGAPRPVYGFASSPLIVGDVVVVHGGPEAGALIGIDLATGERRWSVAPEVVDAQSPVVLELLGRDMVVAGGAEHVFGIDPLTGETLWSYAHGGDGYRGQGSLVPVGLGDDRIFLAHSDDASQVIEIRDEGGNLVAEQVWHARTIRNSYTVAVHHEGYLYAYSARILVCVDAATGELVWRSRAPGDGFITLIGDQMLILTKDGTLHVVRATPTGYEELASGTVFGELTWTPVSYAFGDVFARSLDEVVRIDLHGAADAATAEAVNFNVPRSLDPGDGAFGVFVGELEAAAAAGADTTALIDGFFDAHPELPLIEGDDLVHFVYRSHEDGIAIAGDHVGSRQEAPMVRVGDTDFYYYSARLRTDARVTYAFAGANATVPDPRNPLTTPSYVFDADREFNFGAPPVPMSDVRMPGWELPAHLREPAPDRPRGMVETLTVTSDAFGDVPWQVYLPAGYESAEQEYPVVYYHGQTPGNVAMIAASFDNLIAEGMDPVIVVFAEGFLPPTSQYNVHWAEGVVPAVDARYRTVASAEGRVAVGAGLGTLQALFLAYTHPDMTSGVALHDLFFLDSDWDRLTPLLRPVVERPLRIYMDWGAYGIQNPQEAWDLRTDSLRRWSTLEELGYTLEGGEAPDGTDWASWRNRIDDVMRVILPGAFE